ncbi:hypothetical protein L6452_43675 [Arctium lappa]|uniref:Uncharacterized protein n=1 Tax=Arctium lappa TaxID=4217 RepID=A0ACB8XE37_ARCLA|nr:hypothetical protein L6452_43675 [Arctium lappa]
MVAMDLFIVYSKVKINIKGKDVASLREKGLPIICAVAQVGGDDEVFESNKEEGIKGSTGVVHGGDGGGMRSNSSWGMRSNFLGGFPNSL